MNRNSTRLAGVILLTLAVSESRAQNRQAIVVDLGQRHQTIEGFGTCLISWIPEFERLYATPEFQKIYADELGASMMRINLWGPVSSQPIEDWRQISYRNFNLGGEGHRTRLFIEAGKGFQKINPQMRFIGTAWSPPAWMKENNSIVDKASGAIDGPNYVNRGRTFNNRVKKQYFPHFAKWLVEMAKLHKAEGVPLYAISPGNEVMFTQTFESCVWSAEDFAEIVALLGKMLDEEGLGSTLIFGPETMTSFNWGPARGNETYVQALRKHPEAWKYFDVWATHGYTDGFTTDKSSESAGQFWKLIKDTGKPFWITEGGTGKHEWPAAISEIGAMMHNALVAGNASAFVPWQISDAQNNEHGLMVKGTLTGKTRAAQHYFKFIRPGAVRVGATPGSSSVPASAYLHDKDNTLTIVLANPGKQPRELTLSIAGESKLAQMQTVRTSSASEQFKTIEPTAVKDRKLTVAMPAESMVTLYGEGVK